MKKWTDELYRYYDRQVLNAIGRVLTVGALKRIIADLPNEAVVVTPGADHSYREATAEPATALFHDGGISEDYGEGEGAFRHPVLVIR